MKKLVFSIGREIVIIEIKGKEAWMESRKTGKQQLLPPPNDKFDSIDSKLSYEACKTEQEIADNLIMDMRANGGRLIKQDG